MAFLPAAIGSAFAAFPPPGGGSRPTANGGGEALSGPPHAEGRSRARPGDAEPFDLPIPPVAYEDLVLLVKSARRAMRDKIMDRPERAAGYRPPALAGMRGIVHLTLRSAGRNVAESESEEMAIVDASVAAGTLLGRAALENRDARFADRLRLGGNEFGLELEWSGPPEFLNNNPAERGGLIAFKDRGQWTDELLHSFEPAAEGIGVEFRSKRGRVRPSDIVETDYSPDLALKAAEAAIDLRHSQKRRFGEDIRYFRFGAYHLWQPTARAMPVRLLRGETLVSPEEVTPASLNAAIDRMGTYLHYRQNSNGGFSEEYSPSADRHSDNSSARVQLRALSGLADYAAWRSGGSSGDAALAGKVAADVGLGIENFSQFLAPLVLRQLGGKGAPVDRPAGLALVPPGHVGHLEISARLLSTLLAIDPTAGTANADEARARAKNLAGLIEGLLAAQGEDGRISMAFARQVDGSLSDPSGETDTPDAGAGWALLALAQAHRHRADARIERVISRASSYYGDRHVERTHPVEAAALARALALHYAQSNDARLSDHVFRTMDHFVSLQITERACPYPELRGAISARGPGLVGADTAIYLAALAEGLSLAERVGDRHRAARYRRAAMDAARFVLQLEVSEAGCYFIRSPRDASGGVRTAPWDGRIRADHCAAGVVGLIQARAALFGGGESRRAK